MASEVHGVGGDTLAARMDVVRRVRNSGGRVHRRAVAFAPAAAPRDHLFIDGQWYELVYTRVGAAFRVRLEYRAAIDGDVSYEWAG
jgi:hypothetical protein